MMSRISNSKSAAYEGAFEWEYVHVTPGTRASEGTYGRNRTPVSSSAIMSRTFSDCGIRMVSPGLNP